MYEYPTGSVLPKKDLERVVELKIHRGSYILCYEAYRGIEHDGHASTLIVKLYDKGLSTGSIPKVFLWQC